MKNVVIQKAIDERAKLLVAGYKLLVEGRKLRAKGDRVLSAAVEQLGKNVTIDWHGDGSCTIDGVTYAATKEGQLCRTK